MKKMTIIFFLGLFSGFISFAQQSSNNAKQFTYLKGKNPGNKTITCNGAWKRAEKAKLKKPEPPINPLFLAPPPNDNACQAILVIVDGPAVTGTNVQATVQNNEVVPPDGASCTAYDGWCENPSSVDNSVWYKFVVPPGGAVSISTCGGVNSFDTQVAVWDPVVCSNFSTYAFKGANDDGLSCATNFTSYLLLTGLTPGDTLLVQLDGYLGEEGTFDLEIKTPLFPANDSPCNATPVNIGGSAGTFTLVNATVDPDENSIVPPSSNCISNEGWCEFIPSIDNSVWFTFTAPSTGAVTVSTCNSADPFDTQVAVYEVGSCSDFNTYSLLAANDDGDTALCSTSYDYYTSYLKICGLIPGNTYYLLVDGYQGATGEFDLEIDSFIPSALLISNGVTIAPSCVNSINGVAEIHVTSGITPYHFLWSNGYIGSALIAGSGAYIVTVTDQCGTTITSSVTIPPGNNTLTVTAGGILHICDGTPVSLSSGVTGGIPHDTSISFVGYEISTGSLVKFGLNNLSSPTVITSGSTEAYYAGDFTPTGLYAIDNNNSQLVQIEFTSGTKSTLGKLAVKSGHTWTGMAWDASVGVLYALSSNGDYSTLYTINTTNATSTVVADSIEIPFGIWLACSPSGSLFVLDILSDSLYRVDKVTGAAIAVGSIGFDANQSQGADFDPVSGTLYMAAFNNTSFAAELHTVDTLTGASTFIGYLNDEMDAFACIPYQTGEVYSYNWLPSDSLSATNIPNPVANPSVSTTYSVIVTDACGNTATATQHVTVSNVSAATTKTDVTVFGGADGSATALPAGGGSPYSFVWSNAGTTGTINNLAAGTYTVTVTDAYGCSATASAVVSQPNAVDEISNAGFSELLISPNPSTGRVKLTARLKELSTVEIRIYSATGMLVELNNEPAGMKINQNFDLLRHGKGVYFMEIKTSKGVYSNRIVIQ